MRETNCLKFVFVAVFALMTTQVMAQDTVYRWVDDKGVVHFGNRPVNAANVEEIDVHPDTPAISDVERDAIYAAPSEPSRAQLQREERAKNRAEASQKAQVLAADCRQRQELVARLEPTPRILERGEDGEIQRMDDDKRLEAIDDAKSFIAENCDNN